MIQINNDKRVNERVVVNQHGSLLGGQKLVCERLHIDVLTMEKVRE